MKKILILILFGLFCAVLNSQDITEGTKTKINETEITEEFYSESTIVSANKIHYLYPDYKATPGDVYDIVYLLPSMNESNTIAGFVDNNYEIDLAFIGKVNVKGLIYTEVQEILKTRMQKAYPGAIVNVIIKSTGLFKVTLIGEVKRSYILDAMSLTTLEQIIRGRTTPYASIRDIEIRSEDGTIKHYDLFKYTRFADTKQNPFLKPNDVITIKPLNKKITITGAVKRPGTYEILNTDYLSDVINFYADGYTKLADNSKILIQKKLSENNEFDDKNIIIDGKKRNLSLISLDDYDQISIPSKISYNSNISITGEINKPGTYELIDGTNLYDLIYIHGDGFNKVADTTRIILKRKLDDQGIVELDTQIIDISEFDIQKIILRDFDHVIIPKVFTENQNVMLTGQAKKTGTYVLSDKDTLYDLIHVYGYGFDKFADITRISITSQLDESGKAIVDREKSIINANKDDLKSIYLSDLDHVNIPRLLVETKSVTLSGQVKKTGSFILSEGDTLYDLIEIYGYGFNDFADTSRISVLSMMDDAAEPKKEKTVFDLEKDDLNQIILKDMDTVHIPRVKLDFRQVSISGQIEAPGTYMISDGDTLFDLIETYGYGYTKFAENSKIEIQRRINNNDVYEESTFYIDASETDLTTVILQDYDRVFIPNKTTYSPTVTFQGAIAPKEQQKTSNDSETASAIGSSISNRIDVSIIKGNRVSTVLKKLEGTFTLSSDLEHSFLLRGSEKIAINLKDVISKIDSEYDIVLNDKDIIIVPFRQLKVFVGGSVNAGGAIPFIENRTAEYYIGLAGGYNRTENLFRSYNIRDVYGNKVPKNAIISPEDVIWVNRDHPMSYLDEYAGWITTIISTIVISYQLTDLSATLNK